jgi:aminopeptidase N
VGFYELNLKTDIERHYISGNVLIIFRIVYQSDSIQIDLFPNLIIDSIVWKSRHLTFSRKYTAVFVKFPQQLKPGDKESIRTYYQGTPQKAKKPPWEGGMVWKKDKNHKPWIGVACENDGSSLWWPSKDILCDEADSVHLNMTIPAGLVCLSNGVLISVDSNDQTKTFHWVHRYPVNSYNVTFYIGDFRKISFPEKNKEIGYAVEFYVLPYHEEIARKHFLQTFDVLRFYDSLFGPYPWRKENFKLVEAPFEGMEHQTAIAYGSGYKNLEYGSDYIIVHETAHEWWGNSVTAKDYADIWLHEGFATYCEALYLQHKSGQQKYYSLLSLDAAAIKNKYPLVGPYNVAYWDYRDGDKYFKGAIMLHTFRNYLQNDSLFFRILRTFYREHEYGFATTSDFIELSQRLSGRDLGWFFNQYLFDRRCPQLWFNTFMTYDYNKKAYSDFKFTYLYTGVNAGFKLPVKASDNFSYRWIYPKPVTDTLFIPAKDTYFRLNTDHSYVATRRKSLHAISKQQRNQQPNKKN